MDSFANKVLFLSLRDLVMLTVFHCRKLERSCCLPQMIFLSSRTAGPQMSRYQPHNRSPLLCLKKKVYGKMKSGKFTRSLMPSLNLTKLYRKHLIISRRGDCCINWRCVCAWRKKCLSSLNCGIKNRTSLLPSWTVSGTTNVLKYVWPEYKYVLLQV